MAITPSDFSKIWASNADTPEYTFTEADYLKGWDFVGNLPPTRAQWNAMQKSTDEKMKYVFDNFGAPLTASTVAEMTMQNRVYVYTGNETGYTAGHWYYWNGSWTDGGVYNSNTVQVDPTLTISGAAADAKVTGDNFNDVKDKVEKLIEYVPYDRQLYDVATMIPSTAYLLNMNSSGQIMAQSGSRLYVVEINGKTGETYSFNFCSKGGTSVNENVKNVGIYASDSLPVVNEYVGQIGISSQVAKRGAITLSQDFKYLILRVGSSTVLSYPEEPYTQACNEYMGYVVLRKGRGDYTSDSPTYYEYAEHPFYKVVPYAQGTEYEGKILKVDSNGNLVLSNESGGTDEQRVTEIIEENAVLKNQGSENNSKLLGVGNDGLVTLFENTDGLTPDVAMRLHPTKTLYVGNNVLTDGSVVLGTGWSGNVTDGFTHISGNTQDLTFSLSTDSGSAYIVTIQTSASTEDRLKIAIGNSPKVDPYNGYSTMYVGIVSDGGYLTITPAQNFAGTINIALQKVQNSGTALTLSVNNVNCGQTTANITGFWNVAIGNDSLSANQNGSRNISIGYQSMALFKSGTRNVCVGTFSMPFVQEGDRNIAIGADTIYSLASGTRKAYDNIAIGKAAVHAGEEINKNIGIGSSAMSYNTETARENIAIGYQAGIYADVGNTHIGFRAGYYTKGNYNVSVGHSAGADLYNTGSNNICIGHNSGIHATNSSSSNIVTISNSIAIGESVKATKSNQMVLGSASITEVVIAGKKIVFNQDGSVTWSASSL